MPLWALGIVAMVWLLLVLFWRVNRVWLPYYVTGTVGLTLLLAFGLANQLPLHQGAQAVSVWSLHQTASLLHIPTQVFSQDPSAILVLVVSEEFGWTMLQVSVESSGFLEACVLVSLLVFYPGWSLKRKGFLVLAGLAATAAANLVRLTTMTAMLHYLGKDSLLLAHAVLGRLVFFALVVLIFWLVITRPTLQTLRRKLDREVQA